jgi:hypothetical protein
VIIPRKFNKTVIVNISEPDSFPLVFTDEDDEPGILENIRAEMPVRNGNRYMNDVIWSIAMIGLGAMAGYFVAFRKANRIANEDVYTRIVA